jgi:uncharacterized protein with HEPN domain
MQREAKKYLWDMQRAGQLVAQFTAGRDFDAYLADIMLRSAVERQFEIIGEALAQLAKLDPGVAARISEYQGIIGFRNILIHGYANVNHRLVWAKIEENLPILLRELDTMLNEP